ncbi:DNA-binding protein D-ETS-4 isoform X2 [Agrilus planipennis]|uniref:DNA-binding protein D-ETS-4 isoform X2 n=1 Tax=Agrilus planipennis TaxID=224129 RepID=A0A1W4XFX2_AGRPL|nr:DNA-binding protein D-ETS-4 isoform X2 [Agrilus planipennis]
MLQRDPVKSKMPQTVPSAGFTPPCDYSTFAESFDLSLLPGEEDNPPYLSPSTPLYTYSPPPATCGGKPKIYTTFYSSTLNDNAENNDIDLGPDFQKLLTPDPPKKEQNYLTPPTSGIYLEVPNSKSSYSSGSLSPYQTLLSPNGQYSGFPSPLSDNQTLYPNSPEISLYPHSPTFYPQSPDNFQQQKLIKKEVFYTNSPPYIKEELQTTNSCLVSQQNLNEQTPQTQTSPSEKALYNFLENTPLDRQIKQENSVDFGTILQDFQTGESLFCQSYEKTEEQPEKPKDHQLLREALRDTSFQRRYNIRTFDFPLHEGEIKMEESEQSEITCTEEQLPREKIDPVLTIAIEHMKKDIDNTCKTLGIPKDPYQWTSANVFSWLKYTTNQFGLPSPSSEQWNLSGNELITLTEEEFSSRISQGGSILHAQLEIWKASHSESGLGIPWLQETTSSNTSSGDVSDDEDEEVPMEVESKPSTSRGTGSSHIHLWQFLKELLASPQVHGTCIRWIDRSKGIFKIEDSVKVAKLWGKRKNRPAMNYDKLSRSIRQYYKKGIMKKTERSQRLVYQFCHPYNL